MPIQFIKIYHICLYNSSKMNCISTELDYAAIGKRIRKYRWEQNISQETLADLIGVSTTHMSHIETGATKLSLSVFVKIACALNIPTDLLLNEENEIKNQSIKNTINSAENEKQIRILTELTKAAKKILEKENI